MQTQFPGRIQIEGGIYAGKGVGWPRGVDSWSHPLFQNELQLRWLINADLSGGFPQTRPGYKTRLTFDTRIGEANDWWVGADGPVVHPQMLHRFRPTNGQEQLVFAISGSIFYSLVNPDGSLSVPTQITSLSFNRNADQIVGCECTQSATIINGVYANNIAPRNLLVIQDGNTRAGVWDGIVGAHMNPEKMIEKTSDGSTLYPEAYNQTRVGLWMAWSGNRLWVSRGPNVYASDLDDPTHFTEELQLQSVPVFTFPENITGMIDRGSSGITRSQVVVFTAGTTTTLWSGVTNRLPVENLGPGWAFTNDFKTKIFDEVGAVAGKSIGVHRGILYWKSKEGIVLFDSTQTVNSTQNLPPIDQEMAYSKMRITPSAEGADLTCFGKLKNYAWWSVPCGPVIQGRRYCQETQVLNRQTLVVASTSTNGAFQAGTTGWQGIWTGIKPVEWANVTAGGQERSYALSIDGAGVVHIWEAFQSNRTDNSHRIPWLLETRMHPVQPKIFEYAIFHHFRLLVDQIGGNVDFVGRWRGLKGTYHELLNTSVTSTFGSILLPLEKFKPITSTTHFPSFGLQGRTIISRSYDMIEEACTSQNVESQYPDATDHAFSLCIRVTGRCGISGYLIACNSKEENTEGTADEPSGISERGLNMLPENGCPEHVDGETPNYHPVDQPAQLVASPYVPAMSLGFDYVSPAS